LPDERDAYGENTAEGHRHRSSEKDTTTTTATTTTTPERDTRT